MADSAVVLYSHGTVESLDDLPLFLSNIRHGHAAPPELVEEVRRRYVAIGGRSPLSDTCRALATKLERRMHIPVAQAMRLFRPYAADVLEDLAALGVRRIAVVPLAQHSAYVYRRAIVSARDALAKEGPRLSLVCAENWGARDDLTNVYAARIRSVLDTTAASGLRVIFTAHSLPASIIASGDPYEREVRASAARVAWAVGLRAEDHAVAFQSQGMSIGPGGAPAPWLGPTLDDALATARRDGKARVVVAPIGFLADHVETLYDLDIEARARAEELGLSFTRAPLPNADDDLVLVLEDIARGLLESQESIRP